MPVSEGECAKRESGEKSDARFRGQVSKKVTKKPI